MCKFCGDLLRMMQLMSLIFISTVFPVIIRAQDYDVSDIQCSFATSTSSTQDLITARLKKPNGFKGSPLFADDRSVNPEIDRACTIRQEVNDPDSLAYTLKITDFSRCGVLKRNGFVHVRIWFPQFPGVVMQSDQELIIMCKPPEPTIIQNKAAGFAGSFTNNARISGVVEETPNKLEYEVALYKEAPPIGRIGGNTGISLKNHTKQQQAILNQSELPVDQAVPIGTKLQLRARISQQSVWKFVKLMEVTVSPDPDDPHSPGSVALVRDGCRNKDFAAIIPHQPARYRERSNEVFLDFEAFLLSSMRERSTLWIHSQIKACMEAVDCQPDFCLDLFEPSGHGKKRRALPEPLGDDNKTINAHNDYKRFKENIEYSVFLPGEFDQMKYQDTEQCKNFILISGLLAMLLTLSTILSCALVSKIQNVSRKTIDDYVPSKGYAGRAVLQ